MLTPVKYVKSFSKGQITIPKEFREVLNVDDISWFKLTIKDGKMIIEPMKEQNRKKAYAKKLLTLKGDWFSEKEFNENRREIEERLKKNLL